MNSLDKYELWAMWVANDGRVKQRNMIAKAMEDGQCIFGSPGRCLEGETIEDLVEQAVSSMAGLGGKEKLRAECLRLQYGAGCQWALRIAPAGLAKKAGVSVATFYRHVEKAKHYVDNYISMKRLAS